MNFTHSATITAAVLNAGLGLFVLARSPRGGVQRAFAFVALSTSLWVAAIVAVNLSGTEAAAANAGDAVFVGSNLIAASLVWFGALFPGASHRPGPILKTFVFSGIILAAMAPTGAFVIGNHRSGTGEWVPVYGPLFTVASAYFCLSALYFLGSAVQRLRRTSGLARHQVQYMLLGMSLSLAVGITTNLVFPLFLHNSQYQEVGPTASPFFVIFSGYAIAQFRLVDIRWVIRKSVAYVLTITALGLLFVATIVAVDNAATRYLGVRATAAQAVVAMLLAIAFQPLYQFLQKSVNILFARRTYDYPKTLRRVSQEMASVLDLRNLREHVARSVIELMQVEHAELAIARHEEWEIVTDDEINCPLVGTALLEAMRAGHALVREEEQQNEVSRTAQEIAANMKALNADVAVPLRLSGELVGILLVGPKRAGTVFTDEDIALLSTLANQAAIALRNAQLYQEIRSREQYTQAMLAHLDSAVCTVALDGTPIVANDSARRMFPSRTGQIVLPAILRSGVAGVFRTLQETTNMEFDLLNAAGVTTPVVASICPFVADRGEAESALIVVRDISVLRRLEDERLRADRLSAVSRFAATLAHEIRNPLASIKTFCQLLPDKYTDIEFREGFSQLALQEVERINSLVSKLLVTDHPTRGGWERFAIRDVIQATVQFVRPMMMEYEIDVQLECQDSLPDIRGDAAQLKQLYMNLLINAREVAPPGSAIRIRVFSVESDRQISVVSEIVNQGSPIPPADIPHLFDPFFTTRQHGTGLGLTVCKQVADYHQGVIEVESSAETGTLFRLTIPAAPVTPAPGERAVLAVASSEATVGASV